MQFGQIFETLSMSIRIMSLGKFECTAVKRMCEPSKTKILGKSNENTRRNPIIKLSTLTNAHIRTHIYSIQYIQYIQKIHAPVKYSTDSGCLVFGCSTIRKLYSIVFYIWKRRREKITSHESAIHGLQLTWNAYTDGMVFNVCVFWIRKISSFSRPICGIDAMDVFEKSLFKIAYNIIINI